MYMTRFNILQLLAEHRDKLNELKVKRLALFGSVVRGEEASESDWTCWFIPMRSNVKSIFRSFQ